jgi:prepilin peptidase CpaA
MRRQGAAEAGRIGRGLIDHRHHGYVFESADVYDDVMAWHDYLGAFAIVALASLLLSAGIQDIRTREIANWKSAAIVALAPVWWLAHGLSLYPDVATQIALTAVVLAVFFAAFAMGWMGGGDVKLIAALALWLPVGTFMTMMMVMSIAGGVVTVAMLIEARVRRGSGAIEVPYGVAIVFAALLSIREPIFNRFL